MWLRELKIPAFLMCLMYGYFQPCLWEEPLHTSLPYPWTWAGPKTWPRRSVHTHWARGRVLGTLEQNSCSCLSPVLVSRFQPWSWAFTSAGLWWPVPHSSWDSLPTFASFQNAVFQSSLWSIKPSPDRDLHFHFSDVSQEVLKKKVT